MRQTRKRKYRFIVHCPYCRKAIPIVVEGRSLSVGEAPGADVVLLHNKVPPDYPPDLCRIPPAVWGEQIGCPFCGKRALVDETTLVKVQ